MVRVLCYGHKNTSSNLVRVYNSIILQKKV